MLRGSLTCGGPRVTTAHSETPTTVLANGEGEGTGVRARELRSTQQVPRRQGPGSNRKRALRDASSPPLPARVAAWWPVTLAVTWIRRRNAPTSAAAPGSWGTGFPPALAGQQCRASLRAVGSAVGTASSSYTVTTLAGLRPASRLCARGAHGARGDVGSRSGMHLGQGTSVPIWLCAVSGPRAPSPLRVLCGPPGGGRCPSMGAACWVWAVPAGCRYVASPVPVGPRRPRRWRSRLQR